MSDDIFSREPATDNELSRVLFAGELVTVKAFPNDELAAMNNAIQLYGHLPPQNIAYQRAIESMLVQKSGAPWDVEILRKALAYEINRRMKDGMFMRERSS